MVDTYLRLRHQAAWREQFLVVAMLPELRLIWAGGYVWSRMLKSW